MAPLALTRPLNPAAIRSVPLSLFRALLEPHAAYCSGRGLELAALAEASSAHPALDRFFAQPELGMPGSLARSLSQISIMADDVGFDLLLARLERSRESQGWPSLGLSPLHLALRSWLEHPASFEQALGRRGWEGVRSAREYVGPAPLAGRVVDPEACRALAESVGAWFERQGRTRFCRVVPEDGADKMWFSIRHGRPRKTVCTVVDAERESAVDYRPQAEDLVAYDRRTGRLLVRAASHRARVEYRRAFGVLLHDDAAAFREAPVVTLEPLRRRGVEALAPVPGIRDVVLAELALASLAGDGLDMHLKAPDVFAALARRPEIRIECCEITFAKLLVHYGTGRARKVELRAPNGLSFDRGQQAEVTESFLQERGFLLATPIGRLEPTGGAERQMGLGW